MWGDCWYWREPAKGQYLISRRRRCHLDKIFAGFFAPRLAESSDDPFAAALEKRVDVIRGAFTPLSSAAGGLLGPAFMPGHRGVYGPHSGRVHGVTKAGSFAETETNCGRIRPHRQTGPVDVAPFGRLVVCETIRPVLKHGPNRLRAVLRPLICRDRRLQCHHQSVSKKCARKQKIAR